jgi:hypothetical protein
VALTSTGAKLGGSIGDVSLLVLPLPLVVINVQFNEGAKASHTTEEAFAAEAFWKGEVQARGGSVQLYDGTVQFNEQLDTPASTQSAATEQSREIELLLALVVSFPVPAQLACTK